jgi:SAM-dependent methyltransferase
MHAYTSEFYNRHHPDCERSAERVVPLLLSLFAPGSVLDVGCGDGTWLKTFATAGICDYLGVDGGYVQREVLQIPNERFAQHDLTLPLDLKRRFDLVLSLEVAEHLAPESAGDFVRSLTRHADLVVFSGAIPGQYGEHHVNEQWPSYWARLFENVGFQTFDVLRPRIWNDDAICWWYRQNMLVFATADRASSIPALREYEYLGDYARLDVAHPGLMAFFRATLETNASVKLLGLKLIRLIMKRAIQAGRRVLGKGSLDHA